MYYDVVWCGRIPLSDMALAFDTILLLTSCSMGELTSEGGWASAVKVAPASARHQSERWPRRAASRYHQPEDRRWERPPPRGGLCTGTEPELDNRTIYNL